MLTLHFRAPPWGWVGAQMIQRVEGGKAFYARHNMSGFKECVEQAEKLGYVQTGNRVREFPFDEPVRPKAEAGHHTVRTNPVKSGFSSPERPRSAPRARILFFRPSGHTIFRMKAAFFLFDRDLLDT